MPMPKKKRLSAKIIKYEAEYYRTTIVALSIFSDLLKQGNPLAQSSFGRKMTTSENNNISKNNDQTPDLVVQVSESEGYVCEAKATMSKNDNGWIDHVQQLQRYDDDLMGWWTTDQKLKNVSNTILLVDYEKSIKFRNLVVNKIAKEELVFKNPVGFVGFAQQSSPVESLVFSLDWGNIYNRKIHTELSERKRVPLEDYIATQDRKKFSDTQPPVEYVMEVLWTHLFNEMSINVEYGIKIKSWPIPVNINDLTKELQRAYGQQSSGEREVCFPQSKWIRNALDHFEVIGLAIKVDVEKYIVYYKHLRGDLFEKFYSARKKMEEKIEKKRQGDLFISTHNMEKKRHRQLIEEKTSVSFSEQESS
jgi:hypothetical protein